MNGLKLKLMVAGCLALAAALFSLEGYSQAPDKTLAADAFKDNCSTCHGGDGAGSALGKRLHTPDLRSREIRGKPAAELVQVITKGKDKMPPFEGQLSSDQINALVAYVRSLHSPGSSGSK
jgi:mono/diheme cytochrome c family protein